MPRRNCWLAVGLLILLGGTTLVRPAPVAGEEQQAEITRKVKSKIAPIYPDIAKRMNISGTVKLMVVVAPNGSVKSTKVIGGHPLLASAAEDAVKKWKFEPASEESSGMIEIIFRPTN